MANFVASVWEADSAKWRHRTLRQIFKARWTKASRNVTSAFGSTNQRKYHSPHLCNICGAYQHISFHEIWPAFRSWRNWKKRTFLFVFMNYLLKRGLKSGLKGLRTTLELLRLYVAKSRDRQERIGLVPIYSFQNIRDRIANNWTWADSSWLRNLLLKFAKVLQRFCAFEKLADPLHVLDLVFRSLSKHLRHIPNPIFPFALCQNSRLSRPFDTCWQLWNVVRLTRLIAYLLITRKFLHLPVSFLSIRGSSKATEGPLMRKRWYLNISRNVSKSPSSFSCTSLRIIFDFRWLGAIIEEFKKWRNNEQINGKIASLNTLSVKSKLFNLQTRSAVSPLVNQYIKSALLEINRGFFQKFEINLYKRKSA